MLEKEKLKNRVCEKLRAELAALQKALDDSSAAATDPGSKAESKYDTRSLEMSYLAAGQAKQAEDLSEAIRILDSFPLEPYEMMDAIALGARVELSREESWEQYLLLPAGGGIEVEEEGGLVTTLSPESPLFRAMEGKKMGEEVSDGIFVSEVS